jgi:hypothetical protein
MGREPNRKRKPKNPGELVDQLEALADELEAFLAAAEQELKQYQLLSHLEEIADGTLAILAKPEGEK